MRILIAPDKLKGCLTAAQVAAAIREGFLRGFPDASFEIIPLADGGEGTARLFAETLGGEMVTAPCEDALGRPIEAEYAWLPQRNEAVIDMSAASGLWRISESERDPLRTHTRGTGQLITHAVERGAQTIFIGLGGSATTDGGVGTASELGWQFLDRHRHPLPPEPGRFHEIASIQKPTHPLTTNVVAISDVTNPLLGPRGASHAYGPQKGADPATVESLERALAHVAAIAHRDLGTDHAETPGAGAAGGLGFGLLTFCDAELRAGFDAFAELLDLDKRIAAADLVITAEGRLDLTTTEGKGPGGLARLARQHGKPVIAFGGSVDHHPDLESLFDVTYPIADRPMSLHESTSNAEHLLTRAAHRVARTIHLSKLL